MPVAFLLYVQNYIFKFDYTPLKTKGNKNVIDNNDSYMTRVLFFFFTFLSRMMYSSVY